MMMAMVITDDGDDCGGIGYDDDDDCYNDTKVDNGHCHIVLFNVPVFSLKLPLNPKQNMVISQSGAANYS